MSDKLAMFNPQMMQLFGNGGLQIPGQDREFSTSDSRLTLRNNAKKSDRLRQIEESRHLAVTHRTQAIREIMTLMMDMALAGERMYQERYKMEHDRKMMDLAEKIEEQRLTGMELDNMLKKVKIETGIEELSIMKLENQLRKLQIQKRMDSNDF